MTEIDYTKRKIEAHNIYSAHLSEERTIKVYLPPGYNPAVSYPVLYCHDGLEFFTHGRIATLANQLMAEGKLCPLVIVGIAVQKQTRNDDYSPSGVRHDSYCRFVLDECVPFVEEKYSVARDLHGRFMAGISLGAAVTMSLYLRRRNSFNRLLLFSGAFYEDVRASIKQEANLSDLSAFMVVGEQETEVEIQSGHYDFYRANQTARDLLRVRGADIDYHEAEGTHIWGFWQKEIPSALAWVNAQLSTEKSL